MTSRPGLIVAVACLAAAAYAGTLFSSGFIRDDQYIITGNFLLRSWSSLPRLLACGYWEGAVGSAAPVAEFRPLLMLSYFLNYQVFGLACWSYHAVNVALHAAASALLCKALEKPLGPRRAFAAAALFAVLPVHCEAVAYISGRSELLSALCLLCAWLWLRLPDPRPLAGIGAFVLGLFAKEHVFLFPVFLALEDWTFHGVRFWEKGRRGLYGALATCAAGWLVLRAAILSRPFHGGFDYFYGKGFLVRLLTMARFAWSGYAWPAVTGLGLQADYTRPFYPDSSLADPAGWLALLSWLLAALAALWGFSRRRGWAFWLICAFLFLLPTSNLVLKLDTLGAERFLYFPSMGFCVVLGQAVFRLPGRLPIAALSVLLAWYGALSWSGGRAWLTEKGYYERVLRTNQFSVGARTGLGALKAQEGRFKEAEALFLEAEAIRPGYGLVQYDLGRLYWDQGLWERAEGRFRRAAGLPEADADVWIFLGLAAERRSGFDEAAGHYRRALSIRPWDSLAHYNLARLLWASGQKEEARAHLREFLRLHPSDKDASSARKMLSELRL